MEGLNLNIDFKQCLKAIFDLYVDSSYMENNKIFTNKHGLELKYRGNEYDDRSTKELLKDEYYHIQTFLNGEFKRNFMKNLTE